jgi:hypothetical protein
MELVPDFLISVLFGHAGTYIRCTQLPLLRPGDANIHARSSMIGGQAPPGDTVSN